MVLAAELIAEAAKSIIQQLMQKHTIFKFQLYASKYVATKLQRAHRDMIGFSYLEHKPVTTPRSLPPPSTWFRLLEVVCVKTKLLQCPSGRGSKHSPRKYAYTKKWLRV